MKIYTLSYSDADDNEVVEWLGTQADNNARRKELKKDFVVKEKIVDFPLDKTNVIGFLNKFASTGVEGLLDILPAFESKAGKAEDA